MGASHSQIPLPPDKFDLAIISFRKREKLKFLHLTDKELDAIKKAITEFWSVGIKKIIHTVNVTEYRLADSPFSTNGACAGESASHGVDGACRSQ
jgi:hypothetical protein